MEFDGKMPRDEAERLAIEAECRDCSMAELSKWHGSGRFQCARCCARLVLSTRPDVRKRDAMMSAIARFKGAATRKDIVAEIRNISRIDGDDMAVASPD